MFKAFSITKIIGLALLIGIVISLLFQVAPYIKQAYDYGVSAIESLYSFPAIFPPLWSAMGAPFTSIAFAILGVGAFAFAVMALIRRI